MIGKEPRPGRDSPARGPLGFRSGEARSADREIKKRPDWRARLAAWTERNRAYRFRWGWFDCAIAAADAVEAMTGFDSLAALGVEADWKDEQTAFEAMVKAGFGQLSDAAAALFPEIHPAFAQIGDVAAIATETKFGDALGIVIGDRVLVATPNGLDSRPLGEAVRAFAVAREIAQRDAIEAAA